MRYRPSNIQSNNLFSMMQTGGRVSRGRTAVRRAMQRKFDQAQLEKAQRAEARRQKRGGLLGSIGGLAGGVLGSALVATAGPLGLALATGLGTAGGSLLGQKLGYGKGRTKVDRKGTVYAQDAFGDVEGASSDYMKGIGNRALQSGIKAGLQAGVAGVGKGLYGKFAGKLRKAPVQGAPVQAYSSLGVDGYRFGGDALSVPSSLGRSFTPITEKTFAPIPDDTLLSFIGPPPPSKYQDGGFVPGGDFMDYDQTDDTIYSNIPGTGYTVSTPTVDFRAGARQRRQELAQSVLAQTAGSNQYGGGFDKSSLLGDEYSLTPLQLSQLTDVDTSPITEMATQSTQALRNLSGQPAMATAQTGLGLGAATYQTGQQRQDIQEGFETGVEKFREDVKSDLEGQVADLIAGGADIGMKGEGGVAEYATVPSTLQMSTTIEGAPGAVGSFEITVGGEPHYWSAKMNRYIGKDLWNTMIMGPGGGPNFHGSMQSFQDSQTGQIA